MFVRMTYTYTAEVSFDTTQVTVAAETNIALSGFVTLLEGESAGVNNNEVTLAEGENEIVVRVTTTTTPTTTQDYTITVTRLAEVDSNDAHAGDPDADWRPAAEAAV